LTAKGLVRVRFSDRKWAACRDELDSYEIVKVVDRNYGPDKAMRWELGKFSPGSGTWKTVKEPSLLGPGVLRDERRITTEQHNTLLSQQSGGTASERLEMPARPPPG
jgi:hypothetical protein